MTTRHCSFHLTTVITAVATLLPCVAMAQSVGNGVPIPEVGPRGELVETLPIRLPPVSGPQPKLALTYNSSAGLGLLGVGWGIGGLSHIVKSGYSGGLPADTAYDFWTLDGEELVPCGLDTDHAVSCQFDGTHAPLIDRPVKIVYDETASFWEVTTPDGSVTHYSESTTGVEDVFGIEFVRDTFGRQIDYFWEDGALLRIEGPELTVEFDYLPDDLRCRVSSWKPASRSCLGAVEVRRQPLDLHLRAYVLAYDTSPVTGRPLLASVTEYGTDYVISLGKIVSGSHLAPYLFTSYQPPSLPGELDVVHPLDPYNQTGAFYKRTSGEFNSHYFPTEEPTTTLGYHVLDLNGDGTDDLLQSAYGPDQTGHENRFLRAWLAIPSIEPAPYRAQGFANRVRWVRDDSYALSDSWSLPPFESERPERKELFQQDLPHPSNDVGVRFGDLNGDGLTDIYMLYLGWPHSLSGELPPPQFAGNSSTGREDDPPPIWKLPNFTVADNQPAPNEVVQWTDCNGAARPVFPMPTFRNFSNDPVGEFDFGMDPCSADSDCGGNFSLCVEGHCRWPCTEPGFECTINASTGEWESSLSSGECCLSGAVVALCEPGSCGDLGHCLCADGTACGVNDTCVLTSNPPGMNAHWVSGAWLNTGAGWHYEDFPPPPDVDKLAFADVCANNWDTGLRLVDLNGDGRADLLQSYRGEVNGATGTDHTLRRAWLNMATIEIWPGTTVPSRWKPLSHGIENIPLFVDGAVMHGDAGVRIGDLNADGLPDLIQGVRSPSIDPVQEPDPIDRRGAWLNAGRWKGRIEDTGNAFVSQPTLAPPESQVFINVPTTLGLEGGGYTPDTGLRLLDVNGDRRADLLLGVRRAGTLNEFDGSTRMGISWLNYPDATMAGMDWHRTDEDPGATFAHVGYGIDTSDLPRVLPGDFDGDGALDYAIVYPGGIFHGHSHPLLQGQSFDGVGAPPTLAGMHDVLHQYSTPYGLTASVSYVPSTVWNTSLSYAPARQANFLPGSHKTVLWWEAQHQNPTHGQSLLALYRYEDARWNTRFRISPGFSVTRRIYVDPDEALDYGGIRWPAGWVDPRDANTLTDTNPHTFRGAWALPTGRSSWGEFEERIYTLAPGDLAVVNDGLFYRDGTGAWLAWEEVVYEQMTAARPYIFRPSRTSATLAWSSSEDPQGTVAVDRTYDAYGFVATETNLGFTNEVDNETHRVYDRVHNSADFVLGLVGRETTYAGETALGQKLHETRLYYDGSVDWQTPPTYGMPTRVERWLQVAEGPDVYLGTTTVYDQQDRLWKTIEDDGAITEYVYGTSGDLSEIRDPLYEADNRHKYVYHLWNTMCDAPWAFSDPNGNAVWVYYDEFCRTKSISAPQGREIRFVYHIDPRLPDGPHMETRTTPPAGHSEDLWERTYYDGFGNVASVVKEGPSDAEPIAEHTVRDHRGRVLRMIGSHYHDTTLGSSAEETSDREVTFAHDDLGRIVATQRMALENGVMVAETTSVEYGVRQRTTHIPWGPTRIDTRDAFGRLIRQVEQLVDDPADPNENFREVSVYYAYNPDGTLSEVTDGDGVGNVWRLTHDTLGRQTRLDDVDFGLWEFGYDSNGSMTSQIDPLGFSTATTYDLLGRPQERITATVNNPQVPLVSNEWRYDEDRRGYFNVGHLTSMSDAEGETVLNYDSQGNLVHGSRIVGGIGYWFNKGYDGSGRLAWTRYPDGDMIGHFEDPLRYDQAGRLQAIPDIVDNITYDASGVVLSYNAANGFTSSRQLAGTQLTAMTVANASGTSVLEWGYSQAMAASTRTIDDTTAAVSTTYHYDGFGRLSSIDGTADFIYGDYGNLDYNPLPSGGAYTYPPPGAERRHGALTADTRAYDYDLAGRMIDSNGESLQWREDGKLEGVGAVALGYDANGERIRKAEPSGTTIYLGDDVEVTPNGTNKYVSVGGSLVAKREGCTTRWLHTDHLGSVRGSSDAAGNFNRQDFDVYGGPLDAGIGETRGYLGQYSDGELVALHARHYDPRLGRFVSPDPTVPTGASVGLNRYAFALNDPTGYVDVDGFGPETRALEGIYEREVWNNYRSQMGEWERLTFDASKVPGIGPMLGLSLMGFSIVPWCPATSPYFWDTSDISGWARANAIKAIIVASAAASYGLSTIPAAGIVAAIAIGIAQGALAATSSSMIAMLNQESGDEILRGMAISFAIGFVMGMKNAGSGAEMGKVTKDVLGAIRYTRLARLSSFIEYAGAPAYNLFDAAIDVGAALVSGYSRGPLRGDFRDASFSDVRGFSGTLMPPQSFSIGPYGPRSATRGTSPLGLLGNASGLLNGDLTSCRAELGRTRCE